MKSLLFALIAFFVLFSSFAQTAVPVVQQAATLEELKKAPIGAWVVLDDIPKSLITNKKFSEEFVGKFSREDKFEYWIWSQKAMIQNQDWIINIQFSDGDKGLGTKTDVSLPKNKVIIFKKGEYTFANSCDCLGWWVALLKKGKN